MDPVVTTVLSIAGGAVGAAVLTVIAGFIGAAIQARREHKKWLREKRLDAYQSFLIEINSDFAIRTARVKEDVPSVAGRMRSMHALAVPVILLGSQEVRAAGERMMRSMGLLDVKDENSVAAMNSARQAFIGEVQSELGLERTNQVGD